MNANNILGQSSLISKMERILAGGRIVHAYLFTGPAGIGKKTMSNLLAQALICNEPGDKPCNRCSTCRQFLSGNHPDVIWIRRPEDKTGIIVDQIRSMQAIIKVKPYQAGKRICFIENAHLMTEQAQNALLKTLEEPPSYTVFFLLSDNTSTLLPTIVSRCQVFRVGSLSRETIKDILNQRLGISFEEAGTYAALSQGNPGKAISLAGDEVFRSCREKLINSLSQAGSLKILDIYGLFDENKEHIDELLDILEAWFRDLLIYRETKDASLVVNLDKMPQIVRQSSNFTSWELKKMLENVAFSRKVLKSNCNYQLTIENMLLSF
ncbi:MAG TPA: DNA polymerase III subunit delta' [Clostridiales bacterium]|nr:DNA polymerase III subunit delta' [Clostridiales bacterium]